MYLRWLTSLKARGPKKQSDSTRALVYAKHNVWQDVGTGVIWPHSTIFFVQRERSEKGGGNGEKKRRETRSGIGRGGERGMETEPKTDSDNSAAFHGAVLSYILGRSNDERATES